MEDQAKTGDRVEITKETDASDPTRRTYRVVSEAGLFKNGEHYKKGSRVELNVNSAKAFLEIGDVEEVEK